MGLMAEKQVARIVIHGCFLSCFVFTRCHLALLRCIKLGQARYRMFGFAPRHSDLYFKINVWPRVVTM